MSVCVSLCPLGCLVIRRQVYLTARLQFALQKTEEQEFSRRVRQVGSAGPVSVVYMYVLGIYEPSPVSSRELWAVAGLRSCWLRASCVRAYPTELCLCGGGEGHGRRHFLSYCFLQSSSDTPPDSGLETHCVLLSESRSR